MGTLSHTHGTAFIHVGTHKTGTTSIQAMLAMNDDLLRAAGVFVPKTGRIAHGLAGHHNIAWELAGDPQFDPACGTFEMLLREAAYANENIVCMSSEEFEFLHFDEAALRNLRDGLLAIGYQPKIVLYLRPQCDYLESLYAEIVRVWDIAFVDFLEKIINDGVYGRSRFDYLRVADAFADTFGAENTIIRSYDSAKLLNDFSNTLGKGRLDPSSLTFPDRLNPMPVFRDVIEARAYQLDSSVRHCISSEQRFDPLGLIDVLRLFVTFARSNDRLRQKYGANVRSTSIALLAREILAAALNDRESRYRKQLIRALVEQPMDVAA